MIHVFSKSVEFATRIYYKVFIRELKSEETSVKGRKFGLKTGIAALHRGVVRLQYAIVRSHRDVAALHCGVVLACRQAGMGKKAGSCFVASFQPS